MDSATDQALDRAAEVIAEAEALLITAGAGIGVDSGLPDFRGQHGFWNAYPPYRKLGLDFVDLANPAWFEDDPTLAWGFYDHETITPRQLLAMLVVLAIASIGLLVALIAVLGNWGS